MNMDSAINSLAAAAALANPPAPGDYQRNGLLYCGKCHTPKQARLSFPAGRLVSCLCDCMLVARDTEAAERKARLEREQIARNRSDAFHDKAMHACTFDRDDKGNPKLYQAMLNYAGLFPRMLQEGKGLLLYGSCGTGKTFAAMEVANALIDRGYPVFTSTFGKMIQHIQGLQTGKDEYINGLARYKLLVLDDLAAERDTPFAQEIVYSIVDGRYRSGLPMIITSNITGAELNNPPDLNRQRIYSRLLECCHPIEVSGKDRRKIKLNGNFDEMQSLLGL